MPRLLATSNQLIGDFRGRAVLVTFGCLVCQMGLGMSYVFGPLANDIIAEFDWSRATYSSARAPQIFVIAAASPFIGAMAIRFGARPILAGGSALIGITFLLFSAMQSLWQMYGLVVLLGLAIAALGDITVGQLVTQWVDRGRGLALGIVYTGSNLGGWLLVPLTVGVAAQDSWRTACAMLGAGALVVMLPVALWVVREPSQAKQLGSDPELAERLLAGSERDMKLADALRTRSFWILAGTLFSFFFYFLGMLDCLVLFLTDEGMPRQQATLYFSHSIGLGIASKLGLGMIADRIPHKATILLDYALLSASSLVLLALPDSAPMWLFVGSFGISTAARDVVYPLIVADCFGVRYMAQIYGALMLVLAPAGALGPIFAAAIHDHTGSYDIAFTSFAVLNGLALSALLFVRRER